MSSAHIQKEAKCFGFFFIFFLVLLYSFPLLSSENYSKISIESAVIK
ncbi:hypothetical protein HMPREF9961_0267 [Streptococcus australis ATCC 700641]|nr:hypothetical protein HMPREF9961_0267 [Streptococcus australis ATCC 700641]